MKVYFYPVCKNEGRYKGKFQLFPDSPKPLSYSLFSCRKIKTRAVSVLVSIVWICEIDAGSAADSFGLNVAHCWFPELLRSGVAVSVEQTKSNGNSNGSSGGDNQSDFCRIVASSELGLSSNKSDRPHGR